MKKFIIITFVLFISCFISFGYIVDAHPGGTDSKGGHNCGKASKAKGLCTSYHYHNGGSSKPKSTSTKTTTPPKNTVVATPKLTKVDVYINNSYRNYNPSAYIKNGTTLVPLRGIFEDLNATVEYNTTTKTIKAKKGNKQITLTLGNKVAYVLSNGQFTTVSLSTPAETYNSSTMVPLRFISEALGAKTHWDSSIQAIYITSGE